MNAIQVIRRLRAFVWALAALALIGILVGGLVLGTHPRGAPTRNEYPPSTTPNLAWIRVTAVRLRRRMSWSRHSRRC